MRRAQTGQSSTFGWPHVGHFGSVRSIGVWQLWHCARCTSGRGAMCFHRSSGRAERSCCTSPSSNQAPPQRGQWSSITGFFVPTGAFSMVTPRQTGQG